MDCNMSGFPVQHKLVELTQAHVHRVCDTIQPSHLLSLRSPPAFNLSQHQGLFQWVSSSYQVAKVLEFQLTASVLLMNIQDWFPLELTGCISLQSTGLSSVFSNITVQKHQLFCIQLCSHSYSYLHPYITTRKTIALTRQTFVSRVMSLLSNMLSFLVTVFLSRSECILISWLQSPSAVIFGTPQK